MFNKKNIVILGAGFGGLKAAKVLGRALRRKKVLREAYELVLIDRHHYHTYTPTLYEIATTSEATATSARLKEIVTFPLRKILDDIPIQVIHAEVTDIDLNSKKVLLQRPNESKLIELPFANIIIALGSSINTFNISGVSDHALYFKSFEDALLIRDVIIKRFKEKPSALSVVIGGGGSTGVELAGEIQEWICELKEEYKEENLCPTYTTIIEGSGMLLPHLHQNISHATTNRLKNLGVALIVNDRILEMRENHVLLESKRSLPFDIFIWTGGIKTPEIVNRLPYKRNESGNIVVNNTMKLGEGVYGIGDNVCVIDSKIGLPAQQVARAAISEGKVAALNVLEDIYVELGLKDSANYRNYKLWQYPYVVPAGGKWAAAKIGPIIFTGFLGWIFKGLIELTYFLSIMPVILAFKIWVKGLKIFIKNDRLG